MIYLEDTHFSQHNVILPSMYRLMFSFTIIDKSKLLLKTYVKQSHILGHLKIVVFQNYVLFYRKKIVFILQFMEFVAIS